MKTVDDILEAISALSAAERETLFSRLDHFPDRPRSSQLALSSPAKELEGRPDYILIFDGGSQGNPGPGYGSYVLVRVHDEKRRLRRLDFGRNMTSNEAEYETLIAGLEDVVETITKAGHDPAGFSVEIRGDSKLVINQVKGAWKARDERMRAYRNRVWQLLGRLSACALNLRPRHYIVSILGH
jgi:ribonuclease HI